MIPAMYRFDRVTWLAVAIVLVAVSLWAPRSSASASDPLTPIEDIYAAMVIQNLQSDGPNYVTGDVPVFTYDIVNKSGQSLKVPKVQLNPSFSDNLVGVTQHWIERLGPDNTIPSIPPIVTRDPQGRYAAGGRVIQSPSKVPPSFALSLSRMLGGTSGFPAGDYRYYVEYKELSADGGEVIQSESLVITFEVATPTPSPTPCPLAQIPTPNGCVPQPVGGLSLESGLRALPVETAQTSNSLWTIMVGSAGVASLLALGGAAWYAKRRRWSS